MPQIAIRPIVANDILPLLQIDHGYQSSYVWQMDRVNEEGQLGVRFREIRLPRPVRVEYPRAKDTLEAEWTAHPAVLVGCLESAPVAYISINQTLAPQTAWVTGLVVAPEMRRQGIGSALVLAGQEWASHHGLRHMVLEMQSKNIGAIRLAQRMGYDFCGYHDQYYANQDIAVFFAQHLR